MAEWLVYSVALEVSGIIDSTIFSRVIEDSVESEGAVAHQRVLCAKMEG